MSLILTQSFEDAEAESIMIALGARLQWQWSLRRPHYVAVDGCMKYSVYPPEKPTDPWWLLYITDTTLFPCLIMSYPLPPTNPSYGDIPCETLDEAKTISEYYVTHLDIPEAVHRRKRRYDYVKHKAWVRSLSQENCKNQRHPASRPIGKRRQ